MVPAPSTAILFSTVRLLELTSGVIGCALLQEGRQALLVVGGATCRFLTEYLVLQQVFEVHGEGPVYSPFRQSYGPCWPFRKAQSQLMSGRLELLSGHQLVDQP